MSDSDSDGPAPSAKKAAAKRKHASDSDDGSGSKDSSSDLSDSSDSDDSGGGGGGGAKAKAAKGAKAGQQKKKQRSMAARYFEEEAEVSDESDEEPQAHAGDAQAHYKAARAEYDRAQRKLQQSKWAQSAEALAASFEARAHNEGRFREAREFGEGASVAPSSIRGGPSMRGDGRSVSTRRIGAASEAGLGRSASIVPSTVVQHTPRAIETALPDSKTDPKLWMLKCKEGREAEIMIALMNKFIDLTESDQKPAVFTAVNTTPGVIFVESFFEGPVRTMVVGIQDLYGWRPGSIKLVETQDMPACVTVPETAPIPQKGTWVRIKGGIYKGDCAKVVDVVDGGAALMVKMVPRLNYVVMGLSAAEKKARSKARPPQRFFVKDEVEAAYKKNAAKEAMFARDPMFSKDYVKFEGSVFCLDDGLLIKRLRPNMVWFRNLDGGRGVDVEPLTRADTLKPKVLLAPGDSVIVVRGQLKNLEGTVRSVNVAANTFVLKVRAIHASQIGTTDDLEMPITEVKKVFQPGNHVKVVSGSYIGETGTVVISSALDPTKEDGEFIAVVLLDSGVKEIQCFVNDLQLSTEMATSGNSIDGYELYDLVELGPDQLGVIVGVGRSEVTVLNRIGQISVVKPQALRGKRNHMSEHATTLDSMQHTLHKGDRVKVVTGKFKGKEGTIKHICRNTLFLHSYHHLDHNGVFSARGLHVVGVGLKSRHAAVDASYLGVLEGGGGRGMGGRGGGSDRGGGRGRGRGRGSVDPLVGQTVIIKKGKDKGKIGLCRVATDTTLQIDLHASAKTVIVPRACAEPHSRISSLSAGRLPHSTPSAYPSTPAYGGQTPFSRSGMDSTPGYATPAASVWAPQTPGGQGDEVWEPATPYPFADGDGDAPDATPATPGAGHMEETPHQGYFPVTPSASYEPYSAPASTGMWWVHNAVVDVVGGEYAGRSGVVVNSGPADGSRVVVKVGDVEAPLTSSQIKAAPIHQHDRVVAVDGVYKGTEGTVLYEPDGEDVIVKGREGQVDIIQMASVVKLA